MRPAEQKSRPIDRVERRSAVITPSGDIMLNTNMLSIERCKEILKEEGVKLDDNQIKEVREFLYIIANIETKIKNNKYETEID